MNLIDQCADGDMLCDRYRIRTLTGGSEATVTTAVTSRGEAGHSAGGGGGVGTTDWWKNPTRVVLQRAGMKYPTRLDGDDLNQAKHGWLDTRLHTQ